MSRVEIYYPDDKFIPSDWPIKPQNRQLCVVIFKIIKLPHICFFIEKDCTFLDIQSIKMENSRTEKRETETISYSTMDWNGVDCWKPLGLPEDVNTQILADIEKWFEEDER